jgi:membrane protein YqaA with SNARE-associated domain
MDYLVLAGVVFGLNLLPAFGPPTWAVLVFFRLQSNLAAIPVVLIGALAAAGGRLVLAYGSRRFRSRMSEQRIENLKAVRDVVGGSRTRAAAGLGLFALSPLPSAQLFIAAGVLDEPLLPLTAAFFAGRLVSYSIAVATASAARHSLGSIVQGSLTSPKSIALQVLSLAGLVALLKVDWARILAGRRGSEGGESQSRA